MNGATSTDSTIATLAVGTIRLDDRGAVLNATVFNIKLHSKTQISGMGMFGVYPLIGQAKENTLNNPPCPITATSRIFFIKILHRFYRITKPLE